MNTQPQFSLLLYVDRLDTLARALEAVTCQKLFRTSGQLIVLAPEDTPELRTAFETETSSLKLPPTLLVLPGCGAPAAYNAGLEQATGDWLNFSLSSASLSDNVFARLDRTMPHHKTVSAYSVYPVYVEGEVEKRYPIAPKSDSDISVDLERQIRNVQLLLQAYFFRRDILEGLRFDEDIHDNAFHKFLFQALLNSADPDSDLQTPTFRFLPQLSYRYTIPLENDLKACPLQHEKWWYTDSVRDFFLPYLRSFSEAGETIPGFIQHACVWLIGSRYRCNYNDANKHTLNPEEAAQFHRLCCQAMVYLDNQFILQRGFTPPVKLHMAARIALLRGKAEEMGCEMHLTHSGPEMTVRLQKKDGSPWDGRTDDDIFGLTNKDRVKFEVLLIRYEKKHLIFCGYLPGNVVLPGVPFETYALTWLRGKDPARYFKIPGVEEDIYCLKKHLGFVTMKDYPVSFRIPLKDGPIQKLRFFLDIGGMQLSLRLNFSRVSARLANFRTSYWQFTKKQVLLPAQDEKGPIQELHILTGSTRMEKIKRELAFRKGFLKKQKRTPIAKQALRLRALYFLTRPFFRKKRIWVAFDKLYKAGDNGEYMYQYLREHSEEAGMPECWYIVNKTSPDYPRLKAQKNARILLENSARCLLTCLHAQVFLATHNGVHHFFNDSMVVIRCMSNLFRGKVVCVQHGLSINQIAHFQNRWFDNTELYTCASPFEKRNLTSGYYGYEDEQLQLTGLARYDGLKNQDKKLILITPTWRKELALDPTFGQSRAYNPQFKDTEYCRLYNQLINDPRLIETAKRTGYRVMFLLHPVTSSQLPDFHSDGYVELVPAAGDMSYEQVLTESSLMVTDYSGVQFDFAYQRKPLVYYHPDTLPPHYEEGGLIYETMGFGPICKNNEEIVTTLCQYMESGCRMEPEYAKRADDFFCYSDFNNCERIYHAVEDMLKKKKKVR